MVKALADRTRSWIVPATLLVHVGLLLGGLRTDFVVVDEVGHVPAGLSHWQTGSFALYRVNPPLCRMLAALPVLLARPATDYRRLDESPANRSEMKVGQDFSVANAPVYFDLVCLARLSSITWSVVAAVVIYRWARELYGEGAGRLGLALWCFDPTVLTFGHLVVPDIPAASAGLLATYAFRGYLLAPSTRRAAVVGVLLGIAQLTKFTLLILYVLWPLLWLLARRPWRRDSTVSRQLAVPLAHGVLIVLLSVLLINAGYAFRDTLRPLGAFDFVSQLFGAPAPTYDSVPIGNRFRDRWLGRLPVPVPAEYLQGIDSQRRDFEVGTPSYLAGEWRRQGWWYYYLYALAVKEPLGTLVLVAWALALTLSGHPASATRTDERILWLSAIGILEFVSSQTGFSHHMRYVLPIFPFVAVGTSKLAFYLKAGRMRQGWLVLALLLSSIGSMLRVYPHTLSYFNEAAGGPERGHTHLLLSNSDWGQDLLALKHWLGRHPEARPLGLAVFHFIDPRILGIEFRLPPFGPGSTTDPSEAGPRPGYYAVSVSYLHGAMFQAPDGDGGFTWITRHDTFAYFGRFRPIARAGYSIYIYHITPEQADSERRALGLSP